jgi:multiple sugar transport system permease protein
MVALPALGAFALAFTEYSGIGPPRFSGLENFSRLIGDDGFWRSLGNSLIHIAFSTPLRIITVIGLALLLHDRYRGADPARAAVYLPTVVPDVAYALLWLWLLNPIYGPVAGALGAAGLPSPEWLTDPWSARVGVVLMGAFQIGEGFVIALAARRALPQHLFEAARIDGGKPWFIVTRITLPLMSPVLVLLALRDVILALQMNFVPALILTDGGPRYATTYLPLFVYREAFRYFRLGYASAISLTMFALTAFAIYVQYRMAKRWKLI